MPTQPISISKLNLGVNLRGLTAGINMKPGQAQDSLDVLPREDGAVFRHWGWIRENVTALNGRIVGIKQFTYKGKNLGGGVREGNYGIADDAAMGAYTRRQGLYTGAIVLTTTNFYFWDPTTEAFVDEPALAGIGVAIDLNPKPVFIVVNDNVYIFGYTDFNIRYDPTDRTIYRLGWDDLPTVCAPALAGGPSTLIVGAVYQYATAWWDVFTGEVGPMGTISALTPTAALPSVNFPVGAFPDYAGARHFIGALDNDDVGVVVYRTEPNGEAFYFLDAITPAGGLLAAGTLLDNGLATAKSEKALRSDIADEPRFNAADLYNDIIYTVSWDDGYNVVRYNDWKNTNSYHERWSVLGRSTLPTRHGEALTAISHTPRSLLVLSQQRGFLGSITMSDSGRIIPRWQALPWTVGAVGPKAVCTAGPWNYFLSERGPYRWREGLAEPQWIGRDILALFIDPTSGLCKLNPWSKNQSELCYDQDANVVRFTFPCGGASFPNVHIMYWIHDDIPEIEPEAGWFFASADAQAMDWGNAITGLNADGTPANPFEVKPRLVFGDALGYVSTYTVGHNRGGLAGLIPATGIGQPLSAVNLLVTLGGLPNAGDGLIGMMVEVVHADGTIDVRLVAANDATDITPDVDFTQDPEGSTWYIGGIPAFWRGVPEHVGDPYSHKDVVNVALKSLRLRPITGQEVIDMSVQSGDYPVTYRKTEEVDLAIYHDKTIANMSGRFIQVEFANSRPDGMFCVTGYKWWVRAAETREQDA